VLQVIDDIVAYCGTIGLKIWFGRMWQNPTVGQTALFYGGAVSGSAITWDRAAVIADMVMLASRYANNPTVIGIELNNEVASPPCTFGDGNVDTDLQLFWTDAGNAILNVNPNLLIFCQSYGVVELNASGVGVGTFGDLTGVAQFPVELNVPDRVVYTIHTYPATVNGATQSWALWDQYWGYIYSQGIAPVLISEFGHTASDTSVATQQWQAMLSSYCTAGVSGSIAGIPSNGYPPGVAWFCANASGPSQGDGSPTDNAGFCLLSSADWSTPLPGQLAGLPQLMFYAKS
jgi:endoglucanase